MPVQNSGKSGGGGWLFLVLVLMGGGYWCFGGTGGGFGSALSESGSSASTAPAAPATTGAAGALPAAPMLTFNQWLPRTNNPNEQLLYENVNVALDLVAAAGHPFVRRTRWAWSTAATPAERSIIQPEWDGFYFADTNRAFFRAGQILRSGGGSIAMLAVTGAHEACHARDYSHDPFVFQQDAAVFEGSAIRCAIAWAEKMAEIARDDPARWGYETAAEFDDAIQGQRNYAASLGANIGSL